MHSDGIMCLVQYSKRRSSGGNIPWGEQLQNQNYLVWESLNQGMAIDINISEMVVIITMKDFNSLRPSDAYVRR